MVENSVGISTSSAKKIQDLLQGKLTPQISALLEKLTSEEFSAPPQTAKGSRLPVLNLVCCRKSVPVGFLFYSISVSILSRLPRKNSAWEFVTDKYQFFYWNCSFQSYNFKWFLVTICCFWKILSNLGSTEVMKFSCIFLVLLKYRYYSYIIPS